MSTKSTITDKRFLIPFILVTSLFFLWAIAHNLNDILIKQFQKALDLSRGQSGFIQFAFYLGYFVMAIPAGLVMKRYGYKNGIIFGLLLYAAGAFLFFPAAEVQMYGFFLVALFIIASGLTFLETAANPYIIVLGDPETAETRLNFAQSFNGLGTIMGPVIGGLFIFSGNEMNATEILETSAIDMAAFRKAEAQAVQMPYLIIGLIILALTYLFYKTRMPEVTEETTKSFNSGSIKNLKKHKHLVWGVIAQFFYVGAQVCIWSYFIDYMLDADPTSTEKQAAFFLSLSLFIFMAGRFISTYIMQFVPPNKLLALYSLACIALLSVVIFVPNIIGVYALMMVSFFLSIMFPTIFALGVKGLGDDTKIGSSLIIMAIVGGAVFPPVLGYWADLDTIFSAFVVPMACFLVVLWYGIKGYKVQIEEKTISSKA
jgi:MFS transporter, FHS family, L-fucose permease